MSLSGIKGAIAAGALLALSAFNAYAAANLSEEIAMRLVGYCQ